MTRSRCAAFVPRFSPPQGLLFWLAYTAAAGCGDQQAPFATPGSEDAGVESDGGSPGAGEEPTDGGGAGSVEEELFDVTEPAVTLPPLEVSQRVCFDQRQEATAPSLFIHEGSNRLLVFYNAVSTGSPDERFLYLQTARLDGGAFEFDDPVQVMHDSYFTDMIEGDDALWALTAGGFFASFLLRSPDQGGSWSLEEVFLAGNRSGSCQYKVPLYFFRPLAPDMKFALGHDHDTHIFGCSHRVFLGRLQDGEWIEPYLVTRGTPTGAFEIEGRLVMGSSSGVVYSDDDGESFVEVASGDTTASRVAGGRLVMDDAQALYLVQSYAYGNEQVLAILVSRDRASSWREKWILLRGDNREIDIWYPVIHVTGDLISVAWKEGDRNDILGSYYKYTAMVSHSRDRGQSWSEPVAFDEAGEQENISTLALTSDGERVFAAYAVTGEGISYDFRRVCLVALVP